LIRTAVDYKFILVLLFLKSFTSSISVTYSKHLIECVRIVLNPRVCVPLVKDPLGCLVSHPRRKGQSFLQEPAFELVQFLPTTAPQAAWRLAHLSRLLPDVSQMLSSLVRPLPDASQKLWSLAFAYSRLALWLCQLSGQ